jgi:hypothetical protein
VFVGHDFSPPPCGRAVWRFPDAIFIRGGRSTHAGYGGRLRTVQSSGYGAGADLSGTIMVRTSALREITIDPATDVVKVEAGVRALGLAAALGSAADRRLGDPLAAALTAGGHSERGHCNSRPLAPVPVTPSLVGSSGASLAGA